MINCALLEDGIYVLTNVEESFFISFRILSMSKINDFYSFVVLISESALLFFGFALQYIETDPFPIILNSSVEKSLSLEVLHSCSS